METLSISFSFSLHEDGHLYPSFTGWSLMFFYNTLERHDVPYDMNSKPMKYFLYPKVKSLESDDAAFH